MKGQTNDSAESKEMQPSPQVNSKLHQICFCPSQLIIAN